MFVLNLIIKLIMSVTPFVPERAAGPRCNDIH